MENSIYPNPPMVMVGLPPLAELNYKTYLQAFLELQLKYKLNEPVKFIFELNAGPAYNKRKEYFFYMYELQDRAFNEVLLLISQYDYRGFQKEIYSKNLRITDFSYFDGIFALLKLLEGYKK